MEQNIDHTRELRLQDETIRVLLRYTNGNITLQERMLQERMVEILKKRIVKRHKNRKNPQYLL